MTCVGDCNEDSEVTEDELTTIGDIREELADVSSCRAGDPDGDGVIRIDEYMKAVQNMQNGCGHP